MRATDAQLDWIQERIVESIGARKYRWSWEPPPAAELAAAFRKRFRKRVSSQWIAAQLRMHFRGRKAEAGPRQLLTWSQARFVVETYPNSTAKGTAEALNRRFGTAFEVGQIVNWISDRNRRHPTSRKLHAGGDGKFTKGHNGYPVHNRAEIGEIRPNRMTRGGWQMMIKVAQQHPYTGHRGWMKPLKLHNWEQARGPVPKGHAVLLIDGDWRHCDVDNLALVTRAELARLNQMHFSSLPADKEVRLAAIRTARLKQAAFDREPSYVTLWRRRKEAEAQANGRNR